MSNLTHRTLRLLDLYGLDDFIFSCNETAELFIELTRADRFKKHLEETTLKHIVK